MNRKQELNIIKDVKSSLTRVNLEHLLHCLRYRSKNNSRTSRSIFVYPKSESIILIISIIIRIVQKLSNFERDLGKQIINTLIYIPIGVRMK